MNFIFACLLFVAAATSSFNPLVASEVGASPISRDEVARAELADVQKFVHEYYAAADKTSSLVDLDRWYASVIPKHQPEDAEKTVWLLNMHRSRFPSTVKVCDVVRPRSDMFVFTLAPRDVPASFREQSKNEGFSMKGKAVIIREGGAWKVFQDLWWVSDFTRKNDSGFGIDGEAFAPSQRNHSE